MTETVFRYCYQCSARLPDDKSVQQSPIPVYCSPGCKDLADTTYGIIVDADLPPGREAP